MAMAGRWMRRVVGPSSVPLLLLALWSCSSPGRVSSTDSWPAYCPGLRAPVILGESTTLSFCDTVTGVSCCDAAADESLREEFEAMNVARDAACTTIVKGILCARCIPSSSPLPSFNTPPAGSTTTAESIPRRCAATSSSSSSQQDGDAMCVERIGEGSYLDMAAHPDGSGRAFLSTQDGKIWLATIPAHGSGDTLQIPDDELEASRPFLDLTGRVLELMGVAIHPEFAANRRFFVSYTCDATTSPACVGSGGGTSSQYQLVVAEFSAKSMDTRADPTEVRRIFTMDLPTSSYAYQQQQNGGQILFRPSDGYLYLMTGHYGEFSSNTTTSFLGKIVRFNIDSSTNGQSGGGASNRTANDDSGTTTTTAAAAEEPEIFAAGLGNPRGCSFDSARPSYLFCASVDEQQYESVHLIGSPSANAAFLVVGYGRPVSGTPSILGGRVYRGSADPSLEGRYLYMYGSSAWAAMEAPASSGSYVSTQIPNIMCSSSSPALCTGGSGGGVHGRVVSFGEDNNNDAFILATGGVYRVVAPSSCRARRSRSAAASGLPWMLSAGAFALASAFYVCWKVFAGGQRPVMSCNGWLFRCLAVCSCCNCCNNVMNIHHGPGAGTEAGLQLGGS